MQYQHQRLSPKNPPISGRINRPWLNLLETPTFTVYTTVTLCENTYVNMKCSLRQWGAPTLCPEKSKPLNIVQKMSNLNKCQLNFVYLPVIL